MDRTLIFKYLRQIGIFFAISVIVLLLFRFLGNTINLLVISLFFAASITPLVEEFEKRQISRAWAIGIIYVVLLVILILTIAPAPKIITELSLFFTKLPELIKQIPNPDISVFGISPSQLRDVLQSSLVLDRMQSIGTNLAGRTVSITFGIVNSLGVALLTLLFTAYFVINAPILLPRLLFLIPPKIRIEVEILLPPITRCLGAYVLGKIGTSALLGFLTYVIISPIGVPYSGALGLLVALTNLIPFIGPVLGLIPIIISAWKLGTVTVGVVVGISFLLQQLEAWVFQPLLVGPYLNLDPFELLLSILVGAELGGVIGVLVAPPIAGTGRIIFNHLAKKYHLIGETEDQLIPEETEVKPDREHTIEEFQ